jgi:hypothetical protein
MATRLAHTDKLDADDRPLSTEFHTTILSSALHLHLPATDTREWADLMNSMESVTRRAAATASVHAEGGLAVFLFAFMFEPLNALLDALHLPGRLRWEVDVEHVGGEPRPYVRLIWLPTAGDGAGDDSESAIEAVLVDMMASHALLPQGINDVIEDIGKGGMFVAPDGLTRTKSTGHVRDACGVVDQVSSDRIKGC